MSILYSSGYFLTAAVLMAIPPRGLEVAWCLPLAFVAGWAYRPLEMRLRQLRSRVVTEVERRLQAGEGPAYDRMVAVSLAAEAATVLVFLGIGVSLMKWVGDWCWQWPPLRDGVVYAWKAAPVLGLVGVVRLLGPRGVRR